MTHPPPPATSARRLLRLLPPGLGLAAAVTLAWLLFVELALHSDAVLWRYRSVFAVGRATDKLLWVESHRPAVLIAGNSRIDNGVDPLTVGAEAGLPPGRVFNFGIPGANALVWEGLVRRLEHDGLLGPDGIDTVVLGLDETFFQHEDSLGYYGFFAARDTLLDSALYAAAFGSLVKLWYYAPNLRQLHEPEKALRFLQASVGAVEPVGGGADEHKGYRAGLSHGFQTAEQLKRQEAGTRNPPHPRVLAAFRAMLQRLQQHHVKVFVTATPLLARPSALLDADTPQAAPYRALAAELNAQGVAMLKADVGRLEAQDFADAGHLNDHGAQRFSHALGRALASHLRPAP